MICKVTHKWRRIKNEGYFCDFELLKECDKLGGSGVHIISNEYEVRKNFRNKGENQWQDADFQTIYIFDYDKYKTFEWEVTEYRITYERMYKYVDMQLRTKKLERLCQETQYI